MREVMLGLAALCLLGGCATTQGSAPPEQAPHLGEQWYSWRAQTLGITPAQAMERDAALPGAQGPVPEGILDQHTAQEAAALWRDICSSCHGPEGQPPAVPDGVAEPRAWGFGSRMGFFFGGDKMRQGLYRAIDEGKGVGMPAMGSTLSREQIWALVHHLEGF